MHNEGSEAVNGFFAANKERCTSSMTVGGIFGSASCVRVVALLCPGRGLREWPSAAPFIAAVWETARPGGTGRVGGIRWRLAEYSDGSWRTGLS